MAVVDHRIALRHHDGTLTIVDPDTADAVASAQVRLLLVDQLPAASTDAGSAPLVGCDLRAGVVARLRLLG